MPVTPLSKISPKTLQPKIQNLFDLSAQKIRSLNQSWNPSKGTPVFTVKGKYTSRGWTEWTQGFQYGMAILQFDVTGDRDFHEMGRQSTIEKMAPHLSHIGVHDHGFNNLSTYGNLLRLLQEGRVQRDAREVDFYQLALKVSGAVQAARWTPTADGKGYIHSFNGAHSLFIDTVRSLRSLAVAHSLGHVLMGEQDEKISLLKRVADHLETTAKYNIYYGKGRDAYDLRGRTVHEAIFNVKNGVFRCPSTQQGYSAFSTWTRGLAWAICGFAEQLEYLDTLSQADLAEIPHLKQLQKTVLEAALATADFYQTNTPTCGIPLWDTGAPNLHRLGDYLNRPADPYNAWEPVDSSAAAIAAQGFIRLGRFLQSQKKSTEGQHYSRIGLTIAHNLFQEPYLSTNPKHQGLLLHSIYHRPNGWDYQAPGQKIPNGESSMWGDYHAMELALLIHRLDSSQPYPTFFSLGIPSK